MHVHIRQYIKIRNNFTARTSPTTPGSIQRGKKFTGAVLSDINVCPKYYNCYSPADRFLNKSHLIQAKQRPSNLLTGSVYDKLSKAIWEKFEQNQLTQSTFCHKMYLWRYLFSYIKVNISIFSTCKLVNFSDKNLIIENLFYLLS